MALRVLLADESGTIKKVLQLALQDFGVEIKTVQTGVDVLQVAQSFQPDLIFADILLGRKNGYEVCQELRGNQPTAKIPVILMWSSFMNFDQELATKVGASANLEKPFEVAALRALVMKLVPKTEGSKIANFLQFAEPAKEKSDQPSKTEPTPVVTHITKSAGTPAAGWNMQNFTDISDFAAQETPRETSNENANEEAFTELQLTSNKISTPPSTKAEVDEDDNWAPTDLSRFKLKVTSDEIPAAIELTEPSAEPSVVGTSSFERFQTVHREVSESTQEIAFPEEYRDDSKITQYGIEKAFESDHEDSGVSADQGDSGPAVRVISEDQRDRTQINAISEQVRLEIQLQVQKLVPKIAEKIIREELKKLMSEADPRP